jgi:hypothetical protein
VAVVAAVDPEDMIRGAQERARAARERAQAAADRAEEAREEALAASDPERRELRASEVSDDGRIYEQVQRLRRERAQRGNREPEDLPVVGRPKLHAGRAAIVASYAAT